MSYYLSLSYASSALSYYQPSSGAAAQATATAVAATPPQMTAGGKALAIPGAAVGMKEWVISNFWSS